MLVLILASLLQAPVPTIRAARDPGFTNPSDLQLSRVSYILRTPNRQILVVDFSGESVFRLDSTGSVLAPLARNGAGPGEARGVHYLGLQGDTVWIADGILRRISYFDRNLKFIRSESDQDRCGDPPRSLAPDGRCEILPQRTQRNKPIPDSLPLLLARPKGPTDTLGWLILARMVFRYADGESHVMQVFADNPVPITSRNGRYFAWLGQKPANPKEPASVMVVTRNLLTNTSGTFSVPYEPRPLPGDTIEKVLANFRSNPPPPMFVGYLDSISRRMYRPKYLPAFAARLIDQTGKLWLKPQVAPGTATVAWQVFDLSGKPQFNVILPTGFQLADVSGSLLLGTSLDADDVPTIVQYRLPSP